LRLDPVRVSELEASGAHRGGARHAVALVPGSQFLDCEPQLFVEIAFAVRAADD
jgi:hypothetical protein